MDGRIFKKKINEGYHQIKKCEKFDTSDNITIVLDCNKWKIEYYANGKIIADDMDLEKNKTYHACISVFYSDYTYQLVENPYIDLS